MQNDISPVFQKFYINSNQTPNTAPVGQNYLKQPNNKLEKTPEGDSFEASNNKKKIIKGAFVAAAIAAAAAITCAVIKKKSPKIKDIKFEKGVAYLKNGKKYTGKINDTLKSGDKITFEYVDGVIKSSQRTGKKTFSKTYETINGEKIIKTLKNNVQKETNLTKLQNEAKNSQNKIKDILENNSNLSHTEFKKQASEIKYKNKNQKEQINKIYAEKLKLFKEKQAYERVNKNLEDVTFKNGIAFFDGKPYKGKVHCTFKNGDVATLEYDYKGRLIKSEMKGSKNFIKEYDPVLKDIKIKENGTERKINLDSLKSEGKYKAKQIELAKQKAFLQQQEDKTVKDFAESIKGKSEKELDKISKDLEKESKALFDKAFENGANHNETIAKQLEHLPLEERGKYSLISRKQTRVDLEKNERHYDKIEKLIKRSTDKPVKTAHANTYGTEKELAELGRYYDDYSCNNALRGHGDNLNVDLDKMDSLFKKAPALTEDAVVYRGVCVNKLEGSKNFVHSIKEGTVINDPAFISTSTACRDAQFSQFAHIEGGEDAVIMRIKVPKGTKGVFGGHNEYLLPRNSQIKVSKINIVDGVKIADCEYVLP